MDSTPVVPFQRPAAGAAWKKYTLVRELSRRSALTVLAVALITGMAGQLARTAGLLVMSALFAAGAERADRAAQLLLAGRRVADAMTAPVVSIPAALSLNEVEQQFLTRLPYRVFPVMRGDQVVGVLRRSDVPRQPASEWDRLTAQAVMLRLHPYLIARPTDALEDALNRVRNRAGCLVVMDEGRLQGLLTPSARDGDRASP
jgi:CBS domain-containing protein